MNVLIVLGHPRTDSLCGALADAYRDGALEAGLEVRKLVVADCEFDPDVREVSPTDQPLEPDLRAAQDSIEWADHLVFVYPNWWGTMPARLKGFFDRVFTPGFAFVEYDEGEGAGHEGLLDDKTAELIVTMDMPPWVYRWIYRQPGNNAVKRATLGYAGIRTTRVTNLGPVEESTPEEREEWLEKATRLGERLASGPDSRSTRVRRRATAWLKALRLQFYPMAWVAYTIGALAAVGSSGVLSSTTYWLGFAFLFFLEAATVLSNEYVDYPTDRENAFAGPFTGGSQVLVDGTLEFDDLRRGIGVALALTVAFGGAALAVGPGSLVAGTAVMAALGVLALGYTVPPLELSYRTLGELDVAVTHSTGVLLVGYVLLGGRATDPFPWLLSVPFLLSVLPSITLAGVPDREADRAADKETIAVRFGVDGAARVAVATAGLACLTALVWVAFDVAGGAYDPLVLLSVPHALGLCWLLRDRLWDRTTPGRIDGLMAAALSFLGWFGVVPLLNLL
ncbi:NAD(P)H dehydrogenase (quinone) [Haloterrigena turkmenica DSM 5511]|uniref:NAD(P)H dehydrogenase (Quinone) n=1 Tax=Haloterrigena turkmenica (strain ATCC 51198 / DSM 5511 / JCM 9101 / NCIMB 13204 / VKM B-1734 / 4k) TaxID=543526 RepID=D2RWD2_HALTV|nr:NAD(P)H-dependent oxidoreductase [Haloterrigena turkmenica]ADB59521.1 NAD(P)H dehydrogenase (quinone) [Haloterrigena turkmenica DSM 5511]